MRVTEKRDSRRPAGALALPLSRVPPAWRPLHCVLAHLSKRVGGHAQHALIWLAVHATWPSGLVEVGHRRLWRESGIPDHALRAALKELDKNGLAVLAGRGKHGVSRRQVVLCDGCQRGNSRHAEPAASVAMSYTLEPGRQNGQRGNSRHETEELQAMPAATPVIPGSRTAAASPNGHRPGDVPPSPDPSRVSLRSTDALMRHDPLGTGPGGNGSARPPPAPGRADGKQSKIGAFPAFKADLHDGARVGAHQPQGRESPGAATGDPALHPSDDRLFEPEPPARDHWS